MPGSNPRQSQEQITAALLRQAEERWGRERLEAILPMVIQTAQHIWEISRHLPEIDEEPLFFA